jgi:hypothetical protein
MCRGLNMMRDWIVLRLDLGANLVVWKCGKCRDEVCAGSESAWHLTRILRERFGECSESHRHWQIALVSQCQWNSNRYKGISQSECRLLFVGLRSERRPCRVRNIRWTCGSPLSSCLVIIIPAHSYVTCVLSDKGPRWLLMVYSCCEYYTCFACIYTILYTFINEKPVRTLVTLYVYADDTKCIFIVW